ncbi:MAG: hypothetical protein C0478_11405 [Planctomyces sp.]|nr:hypothetical protein [Planctomyces sp.]
MRRTLVKERKYGMRSGVGWRAKDRFKKRSDFLRIRFGPLNTMGLQQVFLNRSNFITQSIQ